MSELEKVLKQHFDKVINGIADTIKTTIIEGELLSFKQNCAREFDATLEKLRKDVKDEEAWSKVKSDFCSAVHKARVAANQSLDSQVAKARTIIDEICERSSQEVNALQNTFK